MAQRMVFGLDYTRRNTALVGSDIGGNMDLYLMNSTDHVETWSNLVQITTSPMHDDIAFFSYLDGQFIVAWVQTDPEDTYDPSFLSVDTELFFMTSRDALTWSIPIQVTKDPPGEKSVDTIATILPGKNGAEIVWVSEKWGNVAVPVADPDLSNMQRLEGAGFQPSKIKLQNGRYLMGWPVPNEGVQDHYEIHATIVDE